MTIFLFFFFFPDRFPRHPDSYGQNTFKNHQKFTAMKKLFVLLLTLTAICPAVFAQENPQEEIPLESPHIYYVEVYEISSMGIRSVSFNFGEDAGPLKEFKLMDETGDHVLKFNNIIAAVNYLGHQGWEVVTVYQRDSGRSVHNTFYLMRFDSSKHQKTRLVKRIDQVVAGIN